METLIVEGSGRSILILHGGMGDLSSWQEVAARLRERFRVGRLHRRQYRLDIPRKVTMADEVAEVLTAAATLERPVVVGHSSGAVLALESLVASPGLFSAAVLYEPPLRLDRPLGDGTQSAADSGPDAGEPSGGEASRPATGHSASDAGEPSGGEASRPATGHSASDADEPSGGEASRPADRARTALAEGRPGTAFAIFLREIAGIGGDMVTAAEAAINQRPEIGPVVERQLDDNDAIDALGNRLAAYATIDLPVLLLTGDQSPHHLRERSSALQAVLPDARRATLPGEGHNAERSAPEKLADLIIRFIDDQAVHDQAVHDRAIHDRAVHDQSGPAAATGPQGDAVRPARPTS